MALSPIQGIQPIFLEEYVEKEKKDAQISTYLFESFLCHIGSFFFEMRNN